MQSYVALVLNAFIDADLLEVCFIGASLTVLFRIV